MINIEEIMVSLAKRRPLFWSEADFQHELAYEIRKRDESLNVRLEWPLFATERGAIDAIVIGATRFALELKYLCKAFSTTIEGETFTLRQHSAPDQRRYDVCKDLARMEAYVAQTGFEAGVLVLTNDPCYWRDRTRTGTKDPADAAFSLSDQCELAGSLAWGASAGPGTTMKRERSLELRGRYALSWRDYSSLDGHAGKFRYLWIPVALPAAT